MIKVGVNKRPRRAVRAARAGWAVAMLLSAGCGFEPGGARSQRHRERGEDGQTLVLDDLKAIASDASLTMEEKRRLLREAGLRDEDLIDALINAG
ncbi:MAG: hypothetical protein KJ057_05430 [Phycisphaerae bacterium]|nr:MAG: hypothetical protein EDS66_02190 [Planctomycetota bacterium]MBE7456860.1 hypothetical protein [Planctomycetia bacterium]MCK6464307.1 hypothetical protein [Phycisphaerae bacterium]MCL4717900.1 hypothetical protein [Phycisphaerae bacterium]MCQ3919883.1 hypothetical protein [Planctomycetota bacterium]